MIFTYVFVGSAIGAVLRYLVTKINILKISNYNIGATFLVNIIGSFMLGVTFKNFGNVSLIYSLIGTGICGGLTTFSTFNSEIIGLIYEKKVYTAVRYGLFSYGIGLICCLIGYLV